MSRNKETVSKRYRTWGAKICSIDSLGLGYDEDKVSSLNSKQGGFNLAFQIQHIPSLLNSEHAEAILKRIRNEFTEIANRRGYKITSVTEMCCCEDGLDHLNIDKNGSKCGRKTRKMPNNILGYNLTHGKSHRIHLRLRESRNHSKFYTYEEIAGTMCHELAHCEVGPHNAKFYKIMDEIQEQYAVYLVSGFVRDKDGFPLNSNQSFVLGGQKVSSKIDSRIEREKAAENRIVKSKLGGTFILGNPNGNVRNGNKSLKHLPPSEAARIAAERRIEERRRNDSKICLPCKDVMEILDCSSSDDEEEQVMCDVDGKPSSSVSQTKNDCNRDLIVLDDSSSDEDVVELHLKSKSTKCLRYSTEHRTSFWTCDTCSTLNDTTSSNLCFICKNIRVDGNQKVMLWDCEFCTFQNQFDELVCGMCCHERPDVNRETKRMVQEMLQNDKTKRISSSEANRSIRDFNGFNIYGNQKRNSGTLHHLT